MSGSRGGRWWVVWLLAGAGCATTVKMQRLEPDYETTDKTRVKRLAVVTSVASQRPDPPAESVRKLWSLMARRYVNQKREFIAKKDLAAEPTAQRSFAPSAACGDGLEGVLWLNPKLVRQGEGVEAEAAAQLIRCSDKAVIWEAQGAGSWPSSDGLLKEITAEYVTLFGPEVEPYVAPTFHLLKAVLDTLPNPTLSDDDTTEKIELGD